jgi:hypothetical protein
MKHIFQLKQLQNNLKKTKSFYLLIYYYNYEKTISNNNYSNHLSSEWLS